MNTRRFITKPFSQTMAGELRINIAPPTIIYRKLLHN